MRHAFMIVEPKKPSNPGSGVNRHLLCAESDEERDQWVEALTQYLNWGGGGTPTVFDSNSNNNSSQATNAAFTLRNNSNVGNSNSNSITGLQKHSSASQLQQASSSSAISPAASPTASRKVSKDDIKPISAMPLSQFNIDLDQNNKFTHSVPSPHYHPQRSNSADSNVIPATPFSDSETVVTVPVYEQPPLRQRSSMDHAYFPNIHKTATTTISSAAARRRGSVDVGGTHNNSDNSGSMVNVSSSTIITTPNVDVSDGKKKKGNRRTFWAKKIFAGDMATSMPSTNSLRGLLTRNSTDASSGEQPTSLFHQNNSNSKGGKPTSHVFGVPLEEAILVCKISENYELPAVVYRCIEYLEAKNAIQEEGIYRLSGSAVKIKTLKQQFDQGNK